MNNFRIIHTGDFHCRINNIPKIATAFDTIIETVMERKPHAVVIGGDLWDGQTTIDGNSPFMPVYNKIMDLKILVPEIHFIYGTKSHDRPGSLDIFHDPTSGIYVYDKTEAHRFHYGKNGGQYVILPIPGIVKSALIQKAHDDGRTWSADRTDEICAEVLHEIMLGYKIILHDLRKQYPGIIGIVLGHFTITGSVTSTGQIMQSGDVCVPISYLDEIGADYNCLDHIHKFQILNDRTSYSGSAHPVNWGELEQKSFNYIEIESAVGKPGRIVKFEQIPFPFPKMVDLELRYREIGDCYQVVGDSEFEDCSHSEVRVRVHVNANQKDLVSEKDILRILDGHCEKVVLSKFEKIIESPTRERSNNIAIAKTNADKFRAYCKSNDITFNPTVIQKLEQVESEVN